MCGGVKDGQVTDNVDLEIRLRWVGHRRAMVIKNGRVEVRTKNFEGQESCRR